MVQVSISRSIDIFVLFHASEDAYVSDNAIASFFILNYYSTMHRSFSRSVGDAYCECRRGVWDTCWGVGLHY